MLTENKVKRFVNEKTVALATDISLPTLRRWRHERKGPPYVKIGRLVRYDYDLAMEFMDNHKIDIEG